MSDEPTRYVPTDQDLRSSAIYTAERILSAEIARGATFRDPVKQLTSYADAIFKYTKEGQNNG